MAEEQDLDKLIEKRKQLAELLQREGNLSAQRAKAISEQYNTLEEIANITQTVTQNGESFVKELNKAVDAGTGLYDVSVGLVESLKESLGIQTRRNEFDRDLFKINKDITNTLRDQKENLTSESDVSKQIAKNDEKRLAALKISKSLTEGMSEESLKQVQKAQDVYLARQDIEKLIKAELAAVAAGAPYDAAKLERLQASARSLDNSLETQLETLNPMQQQLLFTNMNVAGLEEANAKQKEQLARIQEINKATGLTGAIIGGLSKLPGIGQIFKAQDLEDIKKELLESGQEADKFQIAGKLVSKTFDNLKNTLSDPVFLFTALTGALVRNSKLVNEFQTELGVGYNNALAMRTEIANAADASGDLFINSERLQKSVFALAQNTGVFFDLSSKSAETFTNLTERMGLAANEAGNLTMLLRLQGKDTETTMSNLVGTANAALATSKTTANVKDILGDVAKSSKGLQASFAANPGALAKAAVAARELGATLKDIEATQKSLLSFESSIEAELKAELLTGKQLNLEKARAAALNNDMKTLGEELKKQNVDLASFGKMNVLQQEAMAEAMGMSRDAMAEMLLKQQTQGMAAEEVRAKFGEQAYEQFKAMDASQKMNEAMAKLKDIFANLLTVVTPIIDALAFVLQPIAMIGQGIAKLNEWTKGWASKILGVVVAVKMLSGGFGGLLDKIKGISFGGLRERIVSAFDSKTYTGFFSGIQERFKGLSEPLKGLRDKLMDTFGGAADKAKGIQFDERIGKKGGFRDMVSGRFVSEEAANKAGVFKPGTGPTAAAAAGATDAAGSAGAAATAAPKGAAAGAAGATDAAGSAGATPAPADNGKTLKEKMQNIAEGIKAFADKDVIKGALSMIVAAPGLVALGLASLPLKITEKINGKAIQTGMEGIANGIKAFEGTTKGALALLVATPGLLALGLAAPGLALIGVVGTGIAAGLKGISVGMNALGKNMVGIIKGSIALTTLALPIAAAAAAFQLLEGVDPGAMIAFSVSLGILGTAAAILGSMLPVVAMGALALTTLAIPIAATAAAFSLLKGIDTSMMLGFAAALGVLGLAAAGFGIVAPLIITGSVAIGALGLALLPLAVAMNVAAPAAEQFAHVLSSLGEINVANLFGLAMTLPTLAFGIGALALSIGTAVLAAISLKVLTNALEPLAEMAPKFDITNKSLAGIAGSIALISTSLAGLDVSKLEQIADLGENINITSTAGLDVSKLEQIADLGENINITSTTVTSAAPTPSPQSPGTTSLTEGTTTAANAGGITGEEVRAIVEETVTATINALVPDMVAALKEGQGKIQVTNDNFNNSRQSEGPSRNRNIVNNNFA